MFFPPKIYILYTCLSQLFHTFATSKCELSCITVNYYNYLFYINKNRKLNSLIDGETINFSFSVTHICIAS